MQCKTFGLVYICHNDVADGWSTLCASAITPLSVDNKPLINYGGRQMVTGSTAVEPEAEEI